MSVWSFMTVDVLVNKQLHISVRELFKEKFENDDCILSDYNQKSVQRAGTEFFSVSFKVTVDKDYFSLQKPLKEIQDVFLKKGIYHNIRIETRF